MDPQIGTKRNNALTELVRRIYAGDTSILVYSTAPFLDAGRINISGEKVRYTSKTPTSFEGCTRGADQAEGGDSPRTYNGGDLVWQDEPVSPALIHDAVGTVKRNALALYEGAGIDISLVDNPVTEQSELTFASKLGDTLIDAANRLSGEIPVWDSTIQKWVNAVGGVGRLGKYYTITDDFLGGNIVTGSASVGELGWIHFQVSGGTLSGGFLSERHPGQARLICPAVSGGYSGIACPNGALAVYWNSILEIEWIIACDNGITGQVVVCLTDNSTTFANSIMVQTQTDVNSNKWFSYRVTATVSSPYSFGTITQSGYWQQILMKKVSATICDITVNKLDFTTGAVIETVTMQVTGIANVAMIPMVRLYSYDGAGHGLGIDYFRMTLDPAVVSRGT
jgi:hypothetical protein